MGISKTQQKLERYRRLLEVGQIITSEMSFDVLFPLVIEHTNSIMDTEASSIFLIDEKTEELRSLVSTDLKKSEIRIPATHGIAGWVFQHMTHTVVNDASGDPRFDAAVDAKTGFRTRNILCVPLVNRQKACIGTLQALNKRRGAFTDDDVEALTSLSNYATVALENSRLYEDLKAMNKAKDRAISHLSHELKTPLALISAAIGAASAKLTNTTVSGIEGNMAMAERNVRRIFRLQEEIDGIMNEKATEYQTTISRLVEDAFHFVEHQRGVDPAYEGALALVSDYIGSIYKTDRESVERISARELLHGVCDACRSAMAERKVEIAEDLTDEGEITGNRIALKKVFEGVLRNAIENTPDEGRVEVTTRLDDTHLVVEVRDFGTGITPENQKLIFTGFFHTQETDHYSTKTPYAFNAGGSGADLLRAKVFSERYGFSIGFESTRCAFIPEDTDECPGRISRCPFIDDVSGCRASGTTFCLTIPLEKTDGETS
jgi:signal transduction histidine kinase